MSDRDVQPISDEDRGELLGRVAEHARIPGYRTAKLVLALNARLSAAEANLADALSGLAQTRGDRAKLRDAEARLAEVERERDDLRDKQARYILVRDVASASARDAEARAERYREALREIAEHDFYTMAGYPPAECLRDLARAVLTFPEPTSGSAEAGEGTT